MQALRKSVESSVADVSSTLSVDRTSFQAAVEDQRTYVTDIVGGFTESVEQMNSKLQQQSQDVDHFLLTELKQDMPTGRQLL